MPCNCLSFSCSSFRVLSKLRLVTACVKISNGCNEIRDQIRLSLVMFCGVAFPRDVMDEIWDLIESVSESFSTYLCDIASTYSSDHLYFSCVK